MRIGELRRHGKKKCGYPSIFGGIAEIELRQANSRWQLYRSPTNSKEICNQNI